MIIEIIVYECTCQKCGHVWVTRSHDIPLVCSKCKTLKWNDDCDPLVSGPWVVAKYSDPLETGRKNFIKKPLLKNSSLRGNKEIMKTIILILILNIAALAQFTASGRVTALDGYGLSKVRIFVTNSCGIEPTATMTSSFGYYEVETPECSIFAVIAEVKAHEFSPTERWYVFIGKQQVNLYNANFTVWNGESLLIPEYRVILSSKKQDWRANEEIHETINR